MRTKPTVFATLHLIEAHPEQARILTTHNVTVAIPGIMFGVQAPKMQFPENTLFLPYLVLHNVADNPRTITLTASYTMSGFKLEAPLGTTTLQADGAEQIDFSTLIANASISPDHGTIDIEESFSGNDGDMESESGSIDQSGNYVFEAEAQLEVWSSARILCYWTIFGDTNTMISLWTIADLLRILF